MKTIALVICLLAPLQAAGAQELTADEVWTALDEAASARRKPEDVARTLRTMRARGFGALYDVVTKPRTGSEGALGRRLSRVERAVMLEVLRETWDEAASAHLRGQVAMEGAGDDDRLSVMQVLEHCGDVDTTGILFDAIAGFHRDHYVAPPIDKAMRRTARAFSLRFEDAFFRRLHKRWPELPVLVQRAVLRGIIEAGTPAAIGMAADCFGTDPRLDVATLQALIRRPEAVTDDRVHRRIVELLDASHAKIRAAAARAVGELHLTDSVERLIDLLEEDDRVTRRAARAALRRISGRSLPADPDAWVRWLDAEREWYAEEYDGVQRVLRSHDEEGILFSIKISMGRRLHRDELEDPLCHVVRNEALDAAVRRAGCLALARLRCPGSVEALVETLDASDPMLVKAAHVALQRVTGRKLPEDAASCRKALRLD